MNFSASTIDDLMHDVLTDLINRPFDIDSTRGKSSEIVGASIHLDNPRARFSLSENRGKPLSTLGELLWYLSGSNTLDFIYYYIKRYKDEEENGIIWGGYGPRLFNLRGEINQVKNIIALLKDRPASRRATIQLFDGDDLTNQHKDIPCTCTLQFIVRNEQLNMITYMRSNDAFFGLPHDIFCFTMIQEIVARSIGKELGFYKHFVGSLHLYEDKVEEAKQYLNEGYQGTKNPMPPMPEVDPWEMIDKVMGLEGEIRRGNQIDIESHNLTTYWKDIVLLLIIHSLFVKRDLINIRSFAEQVNDPVYKAYVLHRLSKGNKK